MELASNRRLTFSRDAHHVPWVTFAINLGGSFLLGFGVAVLDAHPHATLRPALTIGPLGAFTTFSTLSLETYRLLAYSSKASPPAWRVVTLGVCAGRVVA